MTSPRSVAGTTGDESARGSPCSLVGGSICFFLTLLWNGESVERIFMGKGQFVMPGTAIDTGACP